MASTRKRSASMPVLYISENRSRYSRLVSDALSTQPTSPNVRVGELRGSVRGVSG